MKRTRRTKTIAMLALGLMALLASLISVFASPYLQKDNEEGTILWTSEVDFIDATGGAREHGDILVDLTPYPGEGTTELPGGLNEELIAVFYGMDPSYPDALENKGLDGFDVIALTTETKVMAENGMVITTAWMPKVFFTTEEDLTVNDSPPIVPVWDGAGGPGAPYAVKHGDLLTNSGVVIPNYFLFEPFDFYYDAGLASPVDPTEAYGWPDSMEFDIGLDAVDVEGITPAGFDDLTEYVQQMTAGMVEMSLRLNEFSGLAGQGPLPDFAIYFSFEEQNASKIDPPPYGPYGQNTYFLGPLSRVYDPLSGTQLPPGTPVTDDDLLMVRLPYVDYRNMSGAYMPDAMIVRVGRDNVPALGGSDLGCLFRDTNKAEREGEPLGLDAVDAPGEYIYTLESPVISPFWSDETGETGTVGVVDALLGYDPFSLVLFSTSVSDPLGRRTQDAAESIYIFPGPTQSPPLFPIDRAGINECDVLGSDSPPFYPLTNPPNPNDGVFRGVELIERLMGDGSNEELPEEQQAGLDGLDVVPEYTPPDNSQAPVVDLNGGGSGIDNSAAFTEDAGAVKIADPTASVTDADSNIWRMTVTLTNPKTGDTMTATGSGGINVTAYNGSTGILLLTGQTTPTAYQTALRTVDFECTSDDPDTTARSITVTAFDSVSTSSVATSTVSVTAVNDPPVITRPASVSVDQDTSVALSGGTLVSISDPDDGGASVAADLAVTSGTMTLAGTVGISFNSGSNGSASMSLGGTLANINTALNGMYYTPTASFAGPAILNIGTSDLGNTGSGGTLTDSETTSITVNRTDWASVYVDFDYSGTEVGTEQYPFDTLGEGLTSVTVAGTIYLQGGTSDSTTRTINQDVTLDQYGSGSVTIGAP